MNIWNVIENVLCLVGLVFRSDEALGRAVIDDVRDFGFGESTRTRCVHKSCIVAAPNDFEVARVVLHTYGDVVSRDESSVAQNIAQSHCLVV